ncbi:MAG TPA: hypothetical protein PL131_02235 [Methylotenera sp.]|nr:hypothetical protein [Methylotenera sp.]HPH04665.1 hypothetical protein [Methylotenera sp.]HPN01466.1 hypothetical protein [Methylotenera sp.]
MKKIEGKIVANFDFNGKQKSDLLKAWKRKNDRELAAQYIDAVRGPIELWLSLVEGGKTAIPHFKDYATKLSKNIASVINTCNSLPEDVVSRMDAMVVERLYLAKYKYENSMSKDALKALAITSHAHWIKTEYPGLEEMWEVLHDFLVIIQDVANELGELKGKAGPDVGNEKLLVSWLAEAYESVFNEIPSSENGSNFRKFAAELSKILGYSLGRDIINELIKNRQVLGKYTSNP